MRKAFIAMLELQDKMNTRVHPQWIDQNFAWFRALWIECAELIDHHGYKWWKQQTPDIEQVQLEIVDIWHFGMSMLLDGRAHGDIADQMIRDLAQQPVSQSTDILSATEVLAGIALTEKQFSVTAFFQLLHAAGMDEAQLVKQYIGKNVLNFFRQDHGYKDGTYIKQWMGREDNEHLSEIMDVLNPQDSDFSDQVYHALNERYQQLS